MPVARRHTRRHIPRWTPETVSRSREYYVETTMRLQMRELLHVRSSPSLTDGDASPSSAPLAGTKIRSVLQCTKCPVVRGTCGTIIIGHDHDLLHQLHFTFTSTSTTSSLSSSPTLPDPSPLSLASQALPSASLSSSNRSLTHCAFSRLVCRPSKAESPHHRDTPHPARPGSPTAAATARSRS